MYPSRIRNHNQATKKKRSIQWRSFVQMNHADPNEHEQRGSLGGF